MLRPFFAVALACAAIVAALPARSAPAAPASVRRPAARATPRPAVRRRGRIAPADEYFGRLQMSVLGVRNKVKDLGLDVDIHPDRARAVLSNALWVEDAMRDWARKYPFDNWLPRYAWALEQMYERIPGDEAHRRALKQLGYVTAYFPQTLYGKVGRAKLALGVATPEPGATPPIDDALERLAVLDGRVKPTLPPTPSPVPTATAESSLEPAPATTPLSPEPQRSPS